MDLGPPSTQLLGMAGRHIECLAEECPPCAVGVSLAVHSGASQCIPAATGMQSHQQACPSIVEYQSQKWILNAQIQPAFPTQDN